MKNNRIKLFILALVLSLIVCVPGMAKTIRSNDGRISFTTSDYWSAVSYGDDAVYTELLSIKLNKDTGIMVKKEKTKLGFRSYRDCSYGIKSALLEGISKVRCQQLKSQGYDSKVFKMNVLENALTFVIHSFRGGGKYIIFETEVAKDNFNYSIMMLASDINAYEASAVLSTLTIDGMPFSKWAE